ncbi:MAG: aminotransferase class I/II-fold pyridoxal phosphate-dependent enzyme [Candidatus Riflebacteria bacterium]|nr:aminotransferase class I/II-fold pyridoxal phosphate-dependent enzyme [Candidatus Riflebacteria bacterium]
MCPVHFSRRVERLRPSSIREMMAIAKQLGTEGVTVYELNMGQPDIEGIPVFSEAITERVKDRHCYYSPFWGENFLRESYAKYLNHYFDRRGVKHLIVEKENVIVTVGASQALCNTFLALCDPGDEILCIEPFFPVYPGFLGVAEGILRTVPTYAEEDFVLPPFERLEMYITPRTRGILFNSPNNPSGKIFTSKEVTRLAKLALKYDLWIIADEVYREMIFGENEAFSLLQVDLSPDEMEKFKHRAIVIDSASKSFALTGTRIGFVVSRPEIIEKIALINAHTIASVSDVIQYGVAKAYEHVLEDPMFFQEMRKTYRERLHAALESVKEFFPGVIAPRPDGAFYLMLQFPEVDDISEYAMFLLKNFKLDNETVAIAPAAGFYQTPGRGKNEVRLALVVDPEKIRRAIFLMRKAWDEFADFLKSQGRGFSPKDNRLGGKSKSDREEVNY